MKKLNKSLALVASILFCQMAYSQSSAVQIGYIEGYVSCANKVINPTDENDIKVVRSFDTNAFKICNLQVIDLMNLASISSIKVEPSSCANKKLPILNKFHCLATIQKIYLVDDNKPILLSHTENLYALKMNFLPNGKLEQADSMGIYKTFGYKNLTDNNKIYYLSASKAVNENNIKFTISENPLNSTTNISK